MDRRVTREKLQAVIQEAHSLYKDEKGGKNADYIPYLSGVDSNLFAIAVCLPGGEIIEAGDSGFRFGIESISKVATALLVLKDYGANTIMDMIGADATGMPFNSIMAILLENDHPSTPLVNAGAIAAVSMVRPVGDKREKWASIHKNINDLCASNLPIIDELYKSESVTNHNNRAIAWLLKSYNRIYDEPDLSLDLYTRQCSLGVTTSELAVFAGTIAGGGINPITRKEIFPARLCEKIISMIASVGFYEKTGNWMFQTGIPAKTGVGGGIMGIIPGTLGIAAFSPPIDTAGNSVRAQKAITHIAKELGLNTYSADKVIIEEQSMVYC